MGMFPFSHVILEFQAMVAAGLAPLRALKAATSVAASLLQLDDIGVLASGKQADIVTMAGDPGADIAAIRHLMFFSPDVSVVPASRYVTRGIIGVGIWISSSRH
jgi:imidazolonepropionase-like amidohydrolase